MFSKQQTLFFVLFCSVFFFFPVQGNLHDRYGHIVALSSKYLCQKMEFHKKVILLIILVLRWNKGTFLKHNRCFAAFLFHQELETKCSVLLFLPTCRLAQSPVYLNCTYYCKYSCTQIELLIYLTIYGPYHIPLTFQKR